MTADWIIVPRWLTEKFMAAPTVIVALLAVAMPVLSKVTRAVWAWHRLLALPGVGQPTAMLGALVSVSKGRGGSLNAYVQTPEDVDPIDVDVPSLILSVDGTAIASAELVAIVGRVLHARFPLTVQDVAFITGVNAMGVSVTDASVRVEASGLPTDPVRLVRIELAGTRLTGAEITGQDVVRVMSE